MCKSGWMCDFLEKQKSVKLTHTKCLKDKCLSQPFLHVRRCLRHHIQTRFPASPWLWIVTFLCLALSSPSWSGSPHHPHAQYPTICLQGLPSLCPTSPSLFVSLPVSLSLCLSFSLSICLSHCLFFSVSVSLSLCGSLSLIISLSLSVCPSLSVYLSLSLLKGCSFLS